MAVRRLSVALGFLAAAVTPAVAAAASSDDVILAKPAPDIVAIWRINPFVSDLVGRKLSDEGFMHAVVAHGETIMASEVAKEPGARTVSLRLVYFHDADDPRYKIETLAGVDRIGTISADAAVLANHAAKWRQRLSRGDVPRELHVELDREMLEKVEKPAS